MDFNLFNWIREGVRQSVMLGVNDAIGQIGKPTNSQDLHDRLQYFAGQIDQPLSIEGEKAKPGNRAAGRKRLGRSLSEIQNG